MSAEGIVSPKVQSTTQVSAGVTVMMQWLRLLLAVRKHGPAAGEWLVLAVLWPLSKVANVVGAIKDRFSRS